jgi:L,D-transpeptidase catalytic domain
VLKRELRQRMVRFPIIRSAWSANQDTLSRIHGTNEPWTIGTNVSSGCIRLTKEDIADFYNHTPVAAKSSCSGLGKPAIKMIIGEWYLDELTVATREIVAYD